MLVCFVTLAETINSPPLCPRRNLCDASLSSGSTVLIPAWGTNPVCYAAWPKINRNLFFNVDLSPEFIAKHSQVSSHVHL